MRAGLLDGPPARYTGRGEGVHDPRRSRSLFEEPLAGGFLGVGTGSQPASRLQGATVSNRSWQEIAGPATKVGLGHDEQLISAWAYPRRSGACRSANAVWTNCVAPAWYAISNAERSARTAGRDAVPVTAIDNVPLTHR